MALEMETVTEEQDTSEIPSVDTNYFSVSQTKFVVLSLCTFGVYPLYWFYKNFCHIKNKYRIDMLPFWRTVFAQICAYSAFRPIQNELDEHSIPLKIYPGPCAALYFITIFSVDLPDPFWLLSFLTFILLIPANDAVTRINRSSVQGFVQNSKFTLWNWLAIVTLGPCLILLILGVFFPEWTQWAVSKVMY